MALSVKYRCPRPLIDMNITIVVNQQNAFWLYNPTADEIILNIGTNPRDKICNEHNNMVINRSIDFYGNGEIIFLLTLISCVLADRYEYGINMESQAASSVINHRWKIWP